MAGSESVGWRSIWRRTSRLERVALLVICLYLLKWLLVRLGATPPRGPVGFFVSFLGFLFFLSVAFFAFEFLRWLRGRLLWSLRNRLIVAYIFIAVVPVLLLLSMAALGSYLAYVQLGAHLLQDDLHERMGRLATTADAALQLVASGGAGASSGVSASPPALQALQVAARRDFPGLTVQVRPLSGSSVAAAGSVLGRATRLVQRGELLWLVSRVRGETASKRPVEVVAMAPVNSDLLEVLAPELGPIQFVLTRPAGKVVSQRLVIEREGREFVPGAQISTRHRALPLPANRLDLKITGATTLEAVAVDPAENKEVSSPVFASFSLRPSVVNRRLFASLGEFREPLVILLGIIGVVFLVLEAAALVTGIALTRTITRTVADLYAATERVKAGDFSYRIRRVQRDQLGALGESFNAMTTSISALLEEQRQKQRLENELSIAREVQAQLFPRSLPSLPGIQLAAICRAARVVSGDYYDFLRLGPTQVGIAIADISGKGISAALLMASLQAALRSQTLLDGAGAGDTAALVDRLNRHLLLNTSEERYATFFYAVYDTATRKLCYTNAGHLPPFYVFGDEATPLEQGGTVVGLLEGVSYEQGTLQIRPGSLLVAYSDGLTEPENVYGEEFGRRRLLQEVLRHRAASPQQLAERLVAAAEEWGGSPEQVDDMTVVVARLD